MELRWDGCWQRVTGVRWRHRRGAVSESLCTFASLLLSWDLCSLRFVDIAGDRAQAGEVSRRRHAPCCWRTSGRVALVIKCRTSPTLWLAHPSSIHLFSSLFISLHLSSFLSPFFFLFPFPFLFFLLIMQASSQMCPFPL